MFNRYCLLLLIVLSASPNTLFAQKQPFTPDLSRALFHTKLDESQTFLLAADHKADRQLTPFVEDELNLLLTYQAVQRIDKWQEGVEFDSSIAHPEKLRLLRGMADLLHQFADQVSKPAKNGIINSFQWNLLPSFLDAYDSALVYHAKGLPITQAFNQLPYEPALVISENFAFAYNTFKLATKQTLLLKYLEEKPNLILPQLSISPQYDYPYADSLITVAAYRNPDELINYAQAVQSPLSKKIGQSNHPLVKWLNFLSKQEKGQLYMPFLDVLYSSKLQIADIDSALLDSSKYYKLLVNTQVAFAGRLANGDTPLVMKSLTAMLKQKSMEWYVTTINGLHEAAPAIRYKSIQGLSVEELYYLMVLNETEIYTSSYIYVYKRLFELMQVKSADSLLAKVHFDRYKKFLTMAANYNTLDHFLGLMTTENASQLMASFVNNLEKGRFLDDIEDAVDVANAYAALKQPTLKAFMQKKVVANLEAALHTGNKKAQIIYRIEKLIMANNDGDSTFNMEDSLGILPVANVPNQYLRDTAGRIVMQMYFYGDAAGKGSFNGLLRLMANKLQWKLKATPDWVEFTSIGTPVPFVLFANRAMDEEQDLDEQAQYKLLNWMEENGYGSAITVHRGHSYFLKYTIDKMLPSKVVVLGSCGAYNNLAEVLKASPDAYIISSKQVGYGEINVQLFMYLINQLKMGKDIAWPVMMEAIAGKISQQKKEGYDDYVFPHQNLGALFIKAYKKAMITSASPTVLPQTPLK